MSADTIVHVEADVCFESCGELCGEGEGDTELSRTATSMEEGKLAVDAWCAKMMSRYLFGEETDETYLAVLERYCGGTPHIVDDPRGVYFQQELRPEGNPTIVVTRRESADVYQLCVRVNEDKGTDFWGQCWVD